jgi:hypothetical protein
MCMRVTGHPSSSQPGAGSAQNASSGSPLDPTPAHNVAGNHFDQSTTQQPSQKPTGEQPPEDRTMTWDELEELRDRLSYILERERAEDGFCPIEEGYYIQYRQAARRAVADINPATPATGTATRHSRRSMMPWRRFMTSGAQNSVWQ